MEKKKHREHVDYLTWELLSRMIQDMPADRRKDNVILGAPDGGFHPAHWGLRPMVQTDMGHHFLECDSELGGICGCPDCVSNGRYDLRAQR